MKPLTVVGMLLLGAFSMLPLLPAMQKLTPPVPQPAMSVVDLKTEINMLSREVSLLMDRIVTGQHEVWPQIDAKLDRLSKLNKQLANRE